MAESDGMSVRTLSRLSMAIAILSLGSSFFQSWNYARNIESVQRNVLRAENLRTCKDIIEVFFQLRLEMEQANAAVVSGQKVDTIVLRAHVYKFGALGTYLANFRDEDVRRRYTELSWGLLDLIEKSTTLLPDDFRGAFSKIDTQFSELNKDCMQAAQSMLL